MNRVVAILMSRDGMTQKEAREVVEECRKRIYDGENPEDILNDELGLEPDYVFDLI